ncbi:IS110 family transposase [Caulobacter segnis]|uniref:IS110 family transposase n=1 Tax=Caulobacter segnis TaxID=88688 RepID=UPI00240F2825|nr:IS110 family transposase [Caulobacter segnis]MDG2523346.1 IS110 family transposase [Caulobacter segnis]
MEQGKSSTRVAGVDVGKRRLDAAVHGSEDRLEVANIEEGREALIGWLKARSVSRVGLEATGGYERAVRTDLEAAGFEVVVHQPLEVRLFARLKRLKAKSDRIDAALIAAATAQVDAVKAAQDPRLTRLAERLTAYEQVSDQLARLKAFMEHVTLKDVARDLTIQMRALARLKAKLARSVLEEIKAHADLAERLKLLMSLPGVGPIVAAGLVVRMPELGAMTRGQAASLLGVAPFDRDSGQFRGQRFITGGRNRPRRLIYIAALSAKRCDPGLKAFAERLPDKGKPPKLIVVAVMRKLIEAANLVLSRGQPWTPA